MYKTVDGNQVNGKAHTRKEVQKMFKTAGISDDNRFNVVRTGDVNAFCTSSDTERLKQVEELAGATVYKVNQVRSGRLLIFLFAFGRLSLTCLEGKSMTPCRGVLFRSFQQLPCLGPLF